MMKRNVKRMKEVGKEAQGSGKRRGKKAGIKTPNRDCHGEEQMFPGIFIHKKTFLGAK